jgi:hypothetical protein
MLSHLFPSRRKAARRSPARYAPLRPRLMLEALEDRCLLATFLVTSTADAGAGTLRQAILAAAGDTNKPTIVFDPTLSGQTITLASALTINNAAFTAANPLTIQAGPGIFVTIKENAADRVFDVAAGNALTLTATPKPAATTPATAPSGLVVTGGNVAGGDGGGIRNQGVLTLTGVTVTGNNANQGGGVATEGTATQLLINGNCTIVSNTAGGGAGVYINAGTSTIDTSTITGNTGGGSNVYINATAAVTTSITNSIVSQGTAPGVFLSSTGAGTLNLAADTFTNNNSGGFAGGGLDVPSGPSKVNIVNSTFAYNVSNSGGGGINFAGTGTLTIVNSTITGNVDTSATGGGGINSTANFNLANSVVAQNSSGGVDKDIKGTLVNSAANGNNFVGVLSAGFNANGTSVVGSGDPKLGPLQNNGGPTLTRSPLTGSPLVDAGNNAKAVDPTNGGVALALDQRGLTRIVNGGSGLLVDVGSVELQNKTTVSAITATGAPAFGQFITYSVTVAAAAGTSVPTGTVTVVATPAGATPGTPPVVLGAVTLDPVSGKATLTTSLTPRGASTLVALYGGDANFLPASSAPFAQNTKVVSYIGGFDPTSGNWLLRNSNSSGPFHYGFVYGLPNWRAVTGDWNGTGISTPAVIDPTNQWYINNVNQSGPPAAQFFYGLPGWIPVTGDWTGSGKTGIGVVDPATMTWYVKDTATDAGAVRSFQFGAPGWIPVTGDWGGAVSAAGFPIYGIGVVDPATMTWYLRNTANAGGTDTVPFSFGGVGWKPVTGDWTGSGVTRVGVFDPSANFYLAQNNAGGTPLVKPPFQFGFGYWTPLSGNWGVKGLTAPLAQLAFGTGDGSGALLDQATLNSVVTAALGRLAAAGVSPAVLTQLAAAHYVVGDTGGALALTDVGSGTVIVSAGAAGSGWYTDPSDGAFVNGRALPGSAAASEFDLLTAVLHEMSHLRGWGELNGDPFSANLLTELLPAGVRRTDALDVLFNNGFSA